MSNEIKKGSLFAKQVIAKLKGDDNEVLANKISRKALSAVESQMAALKAAEVDAEDKVDQAKENLDAAKYPTEMINDPKAYIKGIQSAEDAKLSAEAELKNIAESISYFKDLLASF